MLAIRITLIIPYSNESMRGTGLLLNETVVHYEMHAAAAAVVTIQTRESCVVLDQASFCFDMGVG